MLQLLELLPCWLVVLNKDKQLTNNGGSSFHLTRRRSSSLGQTAPHMATAPLTPPVFLSCLLVRSLFLQTSVPRRAMCGMGIRQRSPAETFGPSHMNCSGTNARDDRQHQGSRLPQLWGQGPAVGRTYVCFRNYPIPPGPKSFDAKSLNPFSISRDPGTPKPNISDPRYIYMAYTSMYPFSIEYTHACTFMYMNMHRHTYTYTHVNIHLHIPIHVHINKHTYMQIHDSSLAMEMVADNEWGRDHAVAGEGQGCRAASTSCI